MDLKVKEGRARKETALFRRVI